MQCQSSQTRPAAEIPAGTWAIDPVWSALEFEVTEARPRDHQGARPRLHGHDRRRRAAGDRGDRRRDEHHDVRRDARRPPAVARLLRHGALPGAPLRVDLGRERRRRARRRRATSRSRASRSRSSCAARTRRRRTTPGATSGSGSSSPEPSTAPTSGSSWNAPLPGRRLPASERGRRSRRRFAAVRKG